MGGLNPASAVLSTIGIADSVLSGVLEPVQNVLNMGGLFGLGDSPEDIRRRQIREQNELALKQLKAQQAMSERQLAQANTLEKQKLAEQSRQANDQRLASLRRAVARQRAQFGAAGTGSSSGSAQAVLLGLFEESDEERENREQLDRLRYKALDQNSTQLHARNVLEATQLAQRNQLKKLAG